VVDAHWMEGCSRDLREYFVASDLRSGTRSLETRASGDEPLPTILQTRRFVGKRFTEGVIVGANMYEFGAVLVTGASTRRRSRADAPRRVFGIAGGRMGVNANISWRFSTLSHENWRVKLEA
jgi:hypothetical protein